MTGGGAFTYYLPLGCFENGLTRGGIYTHASTMWLC